MRSGGANVIAEQQVMAGSPLFVDRLIAELERSDLGSKRLASTLLGMRAVDPALWSSIRLRVQALAERVPEGMRGDLVGLFE